MQLHANPYNLFEMLTLGAKDPQQQATAKDLVLGLVLQHAREGWPQEVPDLLKSYFQRRQEIISVDQGCLFLESCVIIPTGYQEQVLRELHVGHQGIVKM